MKPLYLALFLLLTGALSAQCYQASQFLAGPPVDAPRFGRIPIQIPDAGRGGSRFLDAGFDPGKASRVTASRSGLYRVTSDGNLISTGRGSSATMNTAAVSQVEELFSPGEFFVYGQLDCADIGQGFGYGWDGVTITCEGCPLVHPLSPVAIPTGIDSVDLLIGKNLLAVDNWQYPQEDPNPLPAVNYQAELDAWLEKNPVSDPNSGTFLNTVQRSRLEPISGGVTQTKLTVSIDNVEFNTRTYAGRRTDGIGVSVIEYDRQTDTYRAIASEYILPVEINGEFVYGGVIDLPYPIVCQGGITDGASGCLVTPHYLNYWRVASLEQFQGFEVGTYLYPGNVVRFDLGISGQSTPYPAPPQDECADALELTPSEDCNPVGLQFRGATNAGDVIEDEYCFAFEDVWLTFVANSTRLNFLFDPADDQEADFELLTGDCAGGFTAVDCGSLVGDTEFTDLAIGRRYHIRVDAETTGLLALDTARVCLFGPVTTCRIPQLTIDTTICLDLDSIRVTYTVTDLGGAVGAEVIDDESGSLLTTLNATGTYTLTLEDGRYDIFLRSADGDCESDKNLIINFCVDNPSVNDLCEGAFPLFANDIFTPYDELVYRRGALRVATTPVGGFPGDCARPGDGKDIWFSFTNNGAETTNVSILTEKDRNPFELLFDQFVYRGSCDDLRYEFCTIEGSFLVENVAPGETIFVQVRLVSNENTTFSERVRMAAFPTPLPANADALNPLPLEPGDPPNCTGLTTTAGDPDQTIWYGFTAAATSAELYATEITTILPYNGVDRVGVVVIDAVDGTEVLNENVFAGRTYRMDGLVPNRAYAIEVDGARYGAWHNFELCLAALPEGPVNDEIARAIELAQSPVPIPDTFSVAGATETLPGEFCGFASPPFFTPDVWFEFTATAATATISAGRPTAFEYFAIELYDATDGSAVACASPRNGDFALEVSGLTLGGRYRFRIYDPFGTERSGAAARIAVSVSGVPFRQPLTLPSDLCSNQISVTSTGDGTWKYLADGNQLLVAFLDSEALGTVTATVHGSNGATLRTDLNGIPFSDRSFSIETTTPPSDPVLVAFFLDVFELADLESAAASVSGIGDVNITKFPTVGCQSSLPVDPGDFLTQLASGRITNGAQVVIVEVSSFSSFFLHGGNVALGSSALPVECVDFTSTTSGDDHYLAWELLPDDELAELRLEVSPDGVTWRTGGIYTERLVHRLRADVRAGRFFRLMATYFDGTTAQVCDIVALPAAPRERSLTVYPNPVREGSVTVRLDYVPAQRSLLQLYGPTGRLVRQQAVSGAITRIGNLGELPPGVYTLSVDGRVSRLVLD